MHVFIAGKVNEVIKLLDTEEPLNLFKNVFIADKVNEVIKLLDTKEPLNLLKMYS